MSAHDAHDVGEAELDAGFADAMDEIIAYIARVEGFSPETVRAYSSHLEAFGRWCARAAEDALALDVRGFRR